MVRDIEKLYLLRNGVFSLLVVLLKNKKHHPPCFILMRPDSLLFQGAILKYLPSIINDIQTVFDPVELR